MLARAFTRQISRGLAWSPSQSGRVSLLGESRVFTPPYVTVTLDGPLDATQRTKHRTWLTPVHNFPKQLDRNHRTPLVVRVFAHRGRFPCDTPIVYQRNLHEIQAALYTPI